MNVNSFYKGILFELQKTAVAYPIQKKKPSFLQTAATIGSAGLAGYGAYKAIQSMPSTPQPPQANVHNPFVARGVMREHSPGDVMRGEMQNAPQGPLDKVMGPAFNTDLTLTGAGLGLKGLSKMTGKLGPLAGTTAGIASKVSPAVVGMANINDAMRDNDTPLTKGIGTAGAALGMLPVPQLRAAAAAGLLLKQPIYMASNHAMVNADKLSNWSDTMSEIYKYMHSPDSATAQQAREAANFYLNNPEQQATFEKLTHPGFLSRMAQSDFGLARNSNLNSEPLQYMMKRMRADLEANPVR